VTQVLLPVWCVPRRGYGVEVVGAALLAAAEGAGHRRVAACVDAPAGPAGSAAMTRAAAPIWRSAVAEVLLIALVGVAARQHVLLQV
jgi:hypothetical protein